MTNIIALTAPKHTGKTVAADYLVKEHGFVKHNFKDALVAELKEYYGETLQMILKTYELTGLEGVDYKTIDNLFVFKPPLVRALMRDHGMMRRSEYPDYWVNQWQYRVEDNWRTTFVTDDLRFTNEAQAVKDLGGTIIRLTRPDMVNTDTHPSETEMKQIKADYTIELIPGDKEALYKELDVIMNSI
jgi:hypothetical protein